MSLCFIVLLQYWALIASGSSVWKIGRRVVNNLVVWMVMDGYLWSPKLEHNSCPTKRIWLFGWHVGAPLRDGCPTFCTCFASLTISLCPGQGKLVPLGSWCARWPHASPTEFTYNFISCIILNFLCWCLFLSPPLDLWDPIQLVSDMPVYHHP